MPFIGEEAKRRSGGNRGNRPGASAADLLLLRVLLQAVAPDHGPQVIPGYDLRPSHCARVGHIGRSVYLPWGTIVRGQICITG
eukprot:COSAG06_NODE_95_length_24425_cov_882.571035_20_plen_83_part_00